MKTSFFQKYKGVCAILSLAVIVVAAILSVTGVGLRLGVDFNGGSMIRYTAPDGIDLGAVESALSKSGANGARAVLAGTSTGNQLHIRVPETGEAAEALQLKIAAELLTIDANIAPIDISTVSAMYGGDLALKALYACLVALACVLIYLGLRFGLYAGATALVLVVHDLLIMLSLMVFFRALYSVNAPFVAAAPIVMAFSLIQLLTLFDRVRIHAAQGKHRGGGRVQMAAQCAQEAQPRIASTALIALLMLVSMYILGIASVRELIFPLVIGVLSGVYSTLMFAGPLWSFWSERDSFRAVRTLFRRGKAKKA